jgi:putative peptide zinc metalloprotease protein
MITDDDQKLQVLRPELRLLPGARLPQGASTWLIHDPVQHRFIEIDQTSYEILSKWREVKTLDELCVLVTELGVTHTDNAIRTLRVFLERNQLLLCEQPGHWHKFAAQSVAEHPTALGWLLHNYLFVRLPLINPQPFLTSTLSSARWLASKQFIAIYGMLGCTGLYLASRQWEVFLSTWPEVLSREGAAVAGVILVALKIAHELGHAYTAVHFGCQVPSMGIAFMVLAPMPYTDVTDAWRLANRWQRIRIDCAGVFVETAIACFALFLWAFMPEGGARTTAFLIATISLAATLLININPLMRFDGYYVLSEAIGIKNLQSRSFELSAWALRRCLFALSEPCPDEVAKPMRRFMIAYGYVVWIYRLFVFIGIALLVYHYAFKVLGVILFMVEIVYFVARPVWGELRRWWILRWQICEAQRWKWTLSVFVALICALAMPWSTRIAIPAVVSASDIYYVHAKRPARVAFVHVTRGEDIDLGAPIATLDQSDLSQELRLARTRLQLAKLQFDRRAADIADKEDSRIIESTIDALQNRILGLELERQDLILRAPSQGRLVELAPELHPGRWINSRESIATITGSAGHVARGYISEADVERIAPGSSATFIPDQIDLGKLDVVLSEIAISNSANLEIIDLASVAGGRIASQMDNKGRAIAINAQYLARFQVVITAIRYDQSVRGIVVIDGKPESPFARLWRQVIKVVLREAAA